jgi:rhomboid family GlyGly-CTERM serine protease
MHQSVKQFAAPIILALIVLTISIFGDWGRQALRYLGPLVDHQSAGLSYRWFSGHLTHLGWRHSGLNLAGLASIVFIYGRLIGAKTWLAFTVFCPLGISAGLYMFSPEVGHYVGLSGVLHGMLALGGTLGVLRPNTIKSVSIKNSASWEDVILVLGLWGKIIYEQVLGAVPMTAAIAGDTVIVDAHLYGACLGTIFALVLGLKRK